MDVVESTQTHPWHPKLTPYRFLVLFTTIGLGTAKAYAVSRSLFPVATSVEWVTGVIIFSLLFILGLYEPQPPYLLKWLLSPDLVRVFFRMFSLGPLNYRSDELQESRPSGRRIPITGYHLLTTISISLFGILKAYFAYHNDSPAANVFDWVIGIIISSFLYILGLYENNSVSLMPYLFSIDYSESVVLQYSMVYFSFLVIQIFGMNLCWLANRWLWAFVYESRAPTKPAFYTADGLLVYYSTFWIIFRIFFETILSFVYGQVRSSRSLEFTKISRRIHENGIWILVCLAGSVVFVGFTLVLLGCLCDLFGMDVFLPVKLFVILALGASILCSFGYSSALLYWAVSLLLFVN